MLTDRFMFASATAFLVGLYAVPLACRFAGTLHLLDTPGPLKIHTRPIPRAGGLGIIAALLAGLFVAGAQRTGSMIFLVALGGIWLIGLLDDLLRLPVSTRLLAETGVVLLLWHAGWKVPLFESALSSALATVVFVVFVLNAFNMLDGADGIAAGVTSIIAVGYLWLGPGVHSSLGSAVGWSLLASAASFLVFNFPTARIFLGDSGSTTLGFLVAFLSLDSVRVSSGNSSPFLAIMVFAAMPLADAVFSIIRRLWERKSPFCGDRGHLYDLLLLLGWSPQRVVFAYYSISGLLVFVGRFCSESDPTFAILLFCVILVSLAFAVRRLRAFSCNATGSRSLTIVASSR